MTTIVNHCGSKWAGEPADKVEDLLSTLEITPLDPMFESFGNFVIREPMLPLVRFWGNFYELSYCFSVDSDEPEMIAILTAAVRSNQSSPAYAAAKKKYEERERLRQEWLSENASIQAGRIRGE